MESHEDITFYILSYFYLNYVRQLVELCSFSIMSPLELSSTPAKHLPDIFEPKIYDDLEQVKPNWIVRANEMRWSIM